MSTSTERILLIHRHQAKFINADRTNPEGTYVHCALHVRENNAAVGRPIWAHYLPVELVEAIAEGLTTREIA